MIFGTLQCGFVLNTCELCTDQTNTKWCHKHVKTFRHCEDGDSQTQWPQFFWATLYTVVTVVLDAKLIHGKYACRIVLLLILDQTAYEKQKTNSKKQQPKRYYFTFIGNPK